MDLGLTDKRALVFGSTSGLGLAVARAFAKEGTLPAGGTRALSVQIRISNLLNLVNYAAVDTVVNSPTFGQVLSVRPLRSTQLNVRWKF